VGWPDTILLPFEHVVDIDRAFKLLENRANERRLKYISGALFMHSIDAHEGGGLGQISVPRLPVTLAELHRLEEIRNLGLGRVLINTRRPVLGVERT
jgi:predicted mannosyl-3-phosphoglycerate phosphatase (HAD superfamily)